ncbi:hypothetical protein JST56_00965 [Candidatus Dependentiae bacterium]|nr:hypothetical protein [Candidatus Dependentiae bacterium]
MLNMCRKILILLLLSQGLYTTKSFAATKAELQGAVESLIKEIDTFVTDKIDPIVVAGNALVAEQTTGTLIDGSGDVSATGIGYVHEIADGLTGIEFRELDQTDIDKIYIPQ